MINRQILLKSRPEGAASLGNFELMEGPMPHPGEGEVLMRVVYLSLDPYMRGRMSGAKSYATPAAIGEPMVGGTIGKIVKRAIQNTQLAISSSAMAAGRSTRFRMARVAQTRSDGSAGHDGARRPRHAGDDRLCRSSRNRSAEARGDCRCCGGLRRRRISRRANRQNQRMPWGGDRRRHWSRATRPATRCPAPRGQWPAQAAPG
jgi:hypothetical protein